MSRFTSILLVSPLADGKTWVIRSDFGYDVGHENSGDTVNVPIGFMTDFASIPRIFWTILPKWGTYGNAAVIHDYCYWAQDRSRRVADRIFLEAMTVLNVSRITRRVLFLAVRWFGWAAWRKNIRMKKNNLHRVARSLPLKSIDMPDFKIKKSAEEKKQDP